MTLKELKEKRPPKFHIGDIVRVKNQKRYKVIGKIVASYHKIYPDNLIGYMYDIETDKKDWYSQKPIINRYAEFELVKEG